MKLAQISLLIFTAACGSFACQGQTNHCNASSGLFFQPTIQLRQEARTESEKREPVQQTVITQPPAPHLELSSSLAEGDLHGRSFVRNDVFYLTKTERQFNNDTERFVDQVYRPEIFHIGKLPASCTIWTAIKRKNPLCLLNPYLFEVSW